MHASGVRFTSLLNRRRVTRVYGHFNNGASLGRIIRLLPYARLKNAADPTKFIQVSHFAKYLYVGYSERFKHISLFFIES